MTAMTSRAESRTGDILRGRDLAAPAQWVITVGLILVAFAVRTYDLDARSMWHDEGLTFYRATKDVAFILTNHIIIDGVVTTDLHPPLYFLLLHWILQVAGATPFVARLFSALVSLPSLPLLYLIGRRLDGKWAGLCAALTGALAPVYLWYGQEARPYALLVSVSLLSVYALLRLVVQDAARTDRLRWALIYTLATAATIYTHYSGLFLLGFEGLFLLTMVVQHRWRWLILLLAAAAALISPVMPFVIHRMGLGAEYAYSFVPLGTILKDLANSFALGRSVRPEEVWWLDGLFLLIAFVGLLNLVRTGRRGWALWIVAYLAVPILILYGASYIKPMYMLVRHLLIISPAYYLALGLGLAALAHWHRLALVAGLIIIVMGMGYSIQNYFTDPTYLKDDHRGLARYLEEHVRPGDVVVADGPIRADVLLDFYYDGIAPLVVPLPYTVEPGPETLTALQALASEYDRIWFAYGIPGDDWVDSEGERPIHTWRKRALFQFTQTYFHGFGEAISLYGYLTQSPVLTSTTKSWALPPQAVPLVANFAPQPTLGPQLALVGVELPEASAVAGEYIDVTLYWRPKQHLEDYRVVLSLLDEQRRRWGVSDEMPFGGYFPPSQWPVGNLIAWRQTLKVDPLAPPGRYALSLRVYAPSNGQTLDLVGPDGNPSGQQVDLGEVTVVRPVAPPRIPTGLPTHALRMQSPEVGLFGYDQPVDTATLGEEIPLTLYFTARTVPTRDLSLRLRLVDNEGREGASGMVPPVAVGFPTSQWQPGDVLKGLHNLRLPANASPGVYKWCLSLEDEDGATVPVRRGWWPFAVMEVCMGQVTAEAPPFTATPAAISNPLDVTFADNIHLLGYNLVEISHLGQQKVQPGEAISVTLFWQAQTLVSTSYKVTVQLLSPEARIVGQEDSIPVGWTRPTTGWRPGEVIVDEHTLTVDSEAAPGRHTLIVALYDEQTGQRLPVTGQTSLARDQQTDYVQLTELEVEHK